MEPDRQELLKAVERVRFPPVKRDAAVVKDKFWRWKHFTRKFQKWLGLAAALTFGLPARYSMVHFDFLPSYAFIAIDCVLSTVFAIGFWLWIRASAPHKLRFSKFRIPDLFCRCAFGMTMWLVLWLGILGFANAGTKIAGADYAGGVIPVASVKVVLSYRGPAVKPVSSYCLETPTLPETRFLQLCLPEEILNCAPGNFSLNTYGKETWMGRSVIAESVQRVRQMSE
jgi:hypothetical protein